MVKASWAKASVSICSFATAFWPRSRASRTFSRKRASLKSSLSNLGVTVTFFRKEASTFLANHDSFFSEQARKKNGFVKERATRWSSHNFGIKYTWNHLADVDNKSSQKNNIRCLFLGEEGDINAVVPWQLVHRCSESFAQHLEKRCHCFPPTKRRLTADRRRGPRLGGDTRASQVWPQRATRDRKKEGGSCTFLLLNAFPIQIPPLMSLIDIGRKPPKSTCRRSERRAAHDPAEKSQIISSHFAGPLSCRANGSAGLCAAINSGLMDVNATLARESASWKDRL